MTFTIVGSLFIPFLAATLLYLNNRVKWDSPVPHNHWTTNLVLFAILALFLVVGVAGNPQRPLALRAALVRRLRR